MSHPFTRSLDLPVVGGTLHVGVAGPDPGSGAPVVVAVHGITGSHRSWSPVVRALGDDVTVLAPDLRGRGASANITGPFGMAAHAADVLALLDHCDVATAVVAGHSMGGYVTTRFAALAPDRISAAVLVDGGLPLPRPEGISPDDLLAGILGPALARLSMTFDSREAYHEFWRAHPALGGDKWSDDVTDYVDYDLDPDADVIRSRVNGDAVRADGRDLLDGDTAAQSLAALKCPATLLWAPRGLMDEDRPLLPEPVRSAATAAVPHLVVREVPDTNHYLILLRDRDARPVGAAIRAAVNICPPVRDPGRPSRTWHGRRTASS
jgi:pimeloyl-ACP methyl ester carboxylesterase